MRQKGLKREKEWKHYVCICIATQREMETVNELHSEELFIPLGMLAETAICFMFCLRRFLFLFLIYYYFQ